MKVNGFWGLDQLACVLLLLLPLATGCHDSQRAKAAALNDDGKPPKPVKVDPCAKPDEGCPCEDEGATSKCGSLKETRGDYVICREGLRVCSDGEWGECINSGDVMKPLTYRAPMQGGYSLKALGSAASCDNLCDPECQSLTDTPDGLSVPSDLHADQDGLTLVSGGGGGTCSSLSVTPTSQTVTITGISSSDGSVTATPGSVDFNATCSGGVPAEPTWTLDSYDRAVVDTDGIVTVFSGIGGAINVTASSATDHVTVPVNVVVSIGTLNAAGTVTNDPLTTLYPYNNTVFPLDLKAPLVQYQTGGVNATSVQMALRYPAGSSSPTFLYVDPTTYSTDPKCTTSSDPSNPCMSNTVPAWTPPQHVWNAFSRTAAGNATGGEIVIRRKNGGTTYKEKTIRVKFATESITGTVYYTQYRRNFNPSSGTTLCTGSQASCTYKCTAYSGATCTTFGTSASNYTQGQFCPVGNAAKPLTSANSSMTRAIDLSTAGAVNSNPFNPDNSSSIKTGCPVCHSVSANGNVFVSSNLAWQVNASAAGTTKGIGTIGISASGYPSFTGTAQSPTYTGLSENGASATGGDPYNDYERMGENSRGFAYSAISPDGSLVLQGPSFWGSTIDQPASNNLQDATLKGVTNSVKPYFFAGTNKPGLGVQFAPVGALNSNTRSGNVLTSTANEALVVDGVTMQTNYSVLVWSESDARNNGVYYVSNPGSAGSSKWSLTRRSDADGTPCSTCAAELVPGMDVRVSDGNSNLGAVFYISSPASGSITVNSTNIVFARRTMSPPVYGSTHLTTNYATTTTLSPAPTFSSGVLTASYSGPLVIDGHTLGSGDRVLVKDQATQSHNGLYRVTTVGVGGSSAPLTVDYATAAALPAYSQSGGTLTGSANGTLSIDGAVRSTGDDILVKNETSTSRNGIYTLTQGGVGTSTLANGAVKVATQAALPSYTASGGVLTASNFGALTVDSTTSFVAGTDSILVRSEAATSARHGVYTVTNAGAGGPTSLPSVQYATTTALPTNLQYGTTLRPTVSGALPTIDGATLTTGSSLLVKDEATGSKNGVYTVTVAGGGTTSGLFASVLVATTAALASNTQSSHVLTASANGALAAIDGVSLAVGDSVLVKNESSSQKNGIYTVTNLGSASSKWTLTRRSDADNVSELSLNKQVPVSSGSTLQGDIYYVSTAPTTINTTAVAFSSSTVRVATSGGLAAYTQSGSTLNANNNGALVVDGVTLTAGDAVLVWNEGNQNCNGVYNVANAGSATTKWQLTRRSDADTVGELPVNKQFSVSSGSNHSNKVYYVSTAPTTINSTPVAFTQGSWELTRRSDADATGDLVSGVMIPVTAGSANINKTFYISTTGTITIATTAITFAQAAKWVLTRRSDANANSELIPGVQVSVSSGTDAGETYYVSTPSSGSVTLETTAFAFSLALPWSLTRRSDADAASEIVGMQATVSSGSTNSGKTFYVSAPTSTSGFTVNSTGITFAQGTKWELTRTTDADQTAELPPGIEVSVASGTSNGGTVYYLSSPATGTVSVNTTSMAFSKSSYLPPMMVPVISPDGTKVAYVNANADTVGGAAETGWRRGLSMFSVDLSTYPPAVSNKKRLVNNWNASTAGAPIKWPFFESDSRSLIYVQGESSEFCSTADSDHGITVNSALRRSCFEASYGSMSPTTRGYFDGKLYSVDTQNPSSTKTELLKLNDANEDGDSADSSDAMAYQPTVMPIARGGYRWVIFTSQREFGNQLNAKSSSGTPTDFSCAASMLWVAAVSDTTAAGTDRSNPAFFMPGQNLAPITNNDHYINERGYLVPTPCKATGDDCSSDDECCGADESPAEAACRAPSGWTPADGAPEKTCEALGTGCHQVGESCETSDDCCAAAPCVNFACTELGGFAPAIFTREYVAECPTGYHPSWGLFNYHLTTPGDSSLSFSAQTADDLDDLDAAPVVLMGSSTNTVVSPAGPEYFNVGTKLELAGQSRHHANLRVSVTLTPTTDFLYAPTLHDWEQLYTCEPGE